jgi:hypothetical protein
MPIALEPGRLLDRGDICLEPELPVDRNERHREHDPR